MSSPVPSDSLGHEPLPFASTSASTPTTPVGTRSSSDPSGACYSDNFPDFTITKAFQAPKVSKCEAASRSASRKASTQLLTSSHSVIRRRLAAVSSVPCRSGRSRRAGPPRARPAPATGRPEGGRERAPTVGATHDAPFRRRHDRFSGGGTHHEVEHGHAQPPSPRSCDRGWP